MGLGTLTLMSMLMTPGQAAPDLLPFNQAKMEIPIRYDPALKNDIKDLLLFVSNDNGKSWNQYAIAEPNSDKFLFTAPADGMYWFNMMIVDKNGRRDPPDVYKVAPGLKVLIDTKSPVVQIKSVDKVGEEVNVTWAVEEANPDWSKFRVEYRLSDALWNPVEAKGGVVGSARFRVNQVGPMTVRITAYDTAGNRAEMTKDLAAPANVLVTKETTPAIHQTSARVQGPTDLVPPSMGSLGSTSPMSESPDFKGTPALPGGTGIVTPLEQAPTQPVQQPVKTEIPTGGIAVNTANLPPAQVINVARFDVAFDVENKGPSGVSKSEIWVTRDDGKSWQKWDVSEKGESPVTVDLAKRGNTQVEGIYGIRIVLLSGAGLSKGPPVSGDVPDMRVDVDLTPPTVKIYEPMPDPNQKDTMILRWQAVDRNLAAEPITLEWGEGADGPWHPIVAGDRGTAALGTSNSAAKRLPNTGQYAWKLPQNFPTHKVFLRVTARDMAGNIAEHKTLQPILVDLNKPEAKIQGIIGATSEKR